MKILRNNWLGLLLLVLIIIWLGGYGLTKTNQQQKVENKSTSDIPDTAILAKTLTDKGFKLYGAFWCGHCKTQKAMFGDAFKYINYIECSTPDGKSQTDVCVEANIESYPTWQFPNGQKVPGLMELSDLAKASGYTGF